MKYSISNCIYGPGPIEKGFAHLATLFGEEQLEIKGYLNLEKRLSFNTFSPNEIRLNYHLDGRLSNKWGVLWHKET